MTNPTKAVGVFADFSGLPPEIKTHFDVLEDFICYIDSKTACTETDDGFIDEGTIDGSDAVNAINAIAAALQSPAGVGDAAREVIDVCANALGDVVVWWDEEDRPRRGEPDFVTSARQAIAAIRSLSPSSGSPAPDNRAEVVEVPTQLMLDLKTMMSMILPEDIRTTKPPSG
jgi:hypothetical protein